MVVDHMNVLGLAHVNVTCPAEREAAVLAFYRDTLGLTPIAKTTGRRQAGAWFELGGIELHVSVDPVSVAEQRANPRHIALFVSDLTALEGRLATAGTDLLEDPRPPATGRRRFVRDPAGNRLELIERAPG